jgi:hypothetical protein
MGALEQEIKDFVKRMDVDIVGIAGPERLNGPPSMDPTHIEKGAIGNCICFTNGCRRNQRLSGKGYKAAKEKGLIPG